MPNIIVIELDREYLSLFDRSKKNILELRSGNSYIKLEFLPEEKIWLHRLIHDNLSFETLQIELPGTIDLSEIIIEDIIKKNMPKLKITNLALNVKIIDFGKMPKFLICQIVTFWRTESWTQMIRNLAFTQITKSCDYAKFNDFGNFFLLSVVAYCAEVGEYNVCFGRGV